MEDEEAKSHRRAATSKLREDEAQALLRKVIEGSQHQIEGPQIVPNVCIIIHLTILLG